MTTQRAKAHVHTAMGVLDMQERLGLAAEHGYFLRHQASQEWQNQSGGHLDLGWKDMVIPILQVRDNLSFMLKLFSPVIQVQFQLQCFDMHGIKFATMAFAMI